MNREELREKTIEKLKSCCSRGGDPEKEHGDADNALIEFLEGIGEEEIVRLWEGVSKWYA